MECNVKMTKEMFEASKILAEAICRGKAHLMFYGYPTNKSVKIVGGTTGRGKGIRIEKNVNLSTKIVHKVNIENYKKMTWEEMEKILEGGFQ